MPTPHVDRFLPRYFAVCTVGLLVSVKYCKLYPETLPLIVISSIKGISNEETLQEVIALSKQTVS